MEKKIIESERCENEIIKIRGDGNGAYRAILESLGEPQDFSNLRQLVANDILKEGILDDIFLERNCTSLQEYVDKIRLNSFFVDEPELISISRIKNIWIAIFDELRKTWRIIKSKNDIKPINIAFISYRDTNCDLTGHYNAIKLNDNSNNRVKISPNNKIIKENINPNKDMLPNNIKEVKLKIITWNARSLFNYVKKIFLVDILRTEAPDIAILSETFLLEEDALYAKGYRTYKTRNNKRRKGCCILVSKNVMASIITLKNDIEGRYIKISLKSEGIDIPTTISSIYLEPDGDLNKIPIEVLEADIIAGDLNNAQSDLIKNGVYHLKGIENIKPIKVNNKISDHDIIVGESRARIKVNERFTYIEINEKNKVNENDKALKESFKNGKINLLNPKRTIKKDNYLINPQDLDKYEEFAKIKEIYDYEIREKYNRIEKIIRYGEITKDGWYKINSLFNERKATEIYNKDFMAEGIVQYYKELYADNQKRKVLNHNDIKLKICEIIDIIDKLTPNQESKIWPPKSIARDFF